MASLVRATSYVLYCAVFMRVRLNLEVATWSSELAARELGERLEPHPPPCLMGYPARNFLAVRTITWVYYYFFLSCSVL